MTSARLDTQTRKAHKGGGAILPPYSFGVFLMAKMVLVADFIAGVDAAARLTIERAGMKIESFQIAVGQTDTASIDWSVSVYGLRATIYFPSSLDMLGYISQALADAWVAYWLHELAHALYTDKASWIVAVKEGISGTVNALEDVRIEGRLARDCVAVNAPKLLAALCLDKLNEARAKQGGKLDLVKAFEGFLCYGGREAVLGYDLGGFWAEGLASLPRGHAALASETIARLRKCNNTADVNDLARWLKGQIAAIQQDTPGKGEKATGEAPEGQGEGKGDKGEGKGEKATGEAPEGQGEGEGEGEGEATEGQGEGEGGQPAPQGEGEAPGGQAPQGGEGAGEAGDLTPDLAPQGIGGKATDGQTMQDWQRDTAIQIMGGGRAAKVRDLGKELNAPAMSVTTGLPATAKLDRDIAALIRSPAKTAREHHMEAGRLSRRDIPRLLTGAKNVFSVRKHTPATNTAVMVLVDMSDSMSENGKANHAEKATRLLVRAIERAGGLVCVSGFVGAHAGPCSVALQIVKPFGKRAVACTSEELKRPRGGTPMSPAIVAATRILENERTATRRLMIVLTDGQCNKGTAGTLFASRYAAQHGVEVMALGIGCDPGKGFPVSVSVPSVKALGETGLGVVLKALKAAA